jgi:hypothetical protein
LHAIKRMLERSITVDDVRMVLVHGETIEVYPDAKPYPCRLVLGWRDARPLHIVVADDAESNSAIIVTVYEPDRQRWDRSLRRRRR